MCVTQPAPVHAALVPAKSWEVLAPVPAWQATPGWQAAVAFPVAEPVPIGSAAPVASDWLDAEEHPVSGQLTLALVSAWLIGPCAAWSWPGCCWAG
ncbi:hypothetical protein GCM10023321_50600 [Pseudonocardia eucalypti]|uniref:Uncharacterized protein n=1 Tax=Pseudonocardia eucalypti TaxID=648755 RepID=A0ABP9QKS7_9PSEU